MDAGEDAGTIEPETIAQSLDNPGYIALDATHIYMLANAEVRRCALPDCAGVTELVAGPLSVPNAVAVAQGTAYWTQDYQRIMSCSVASVPCSGSVFADLGPSSYPAHLFVSGGLLYWISESGPARRVQACPLSGCGASYPKTVYESTDGSPIHSQPLTGLALDGTQAFFVSFTGAVTRFAMTGPESFDPQSGTSIASSGYSTHGVDLDGDTLRWGVQDEGRIRACMVPGCAAPADFVTGQASPSGTRATTAYVYGINRGPSGVAGAGSLWRVAK